MLMREFQGGNTSEAPLLSRRSFLIGLGAVMALELTGCGNGKSDELLPEKEVRTNLPEVDGDVFNSNPLEYMDREYLSGLFDTLRTEIKDKETKVKAVQGSLRRIKDTTDGMEATVFQIDESGYYLTAKHTLPHDLAGHLVTVANPYDGEESLVTECRVHPSADIAVLYAPNGRPPRAIEGLQLDFPNFEDEQELWMIGLYTNKDQELFRCIKYGQVDEGVELSHDTFGERTRVAVRKMIPFGGTSGSPIVNSEGTIVGVESGAFPDNAKTLKEYDGAVIAPLSYISELPSQPSITI
jgi:hypothetical protein